MAACPAPAGQQEVRECFMGRTANLKWAACAPVIVRRLAIKAYPEYFVTQISAPTLLLFSSLMCQGAFIRALPYQGVQRSPLAPFTQIFPGCLGGPILPRAIPPPAQPGQLLACAHPLCERTKALVDRMQHFLQQNFLVQSKS